MALCWNYVKLPLLYFDVNTSLMYFKCFKAFKFPDSNKNSGQLKLQHLRPNQNFTGDPVQQKMAELNKLPLNIQTWVCSLKGFYFCRNHRLYCYSKYTLSPKLSCRTDLATLLIATSLGFFCHWQILLAMILYHFSDTCYTCYSRDLVTLNQVCFCGRLVINYANGDFLFKVTICNLIVDHS